MEYRITALAGVISDFQLFRLPRNPEEEQQLGEQVVLTGTASTGQGFLTVAVPPAAISSPTAVDVFATTFKNIAGDGTSAVANGDRAPDYGTLDTATRQVVVRQPGITQVVTMTDPAGDVSLNGFDLVSATIATVADQFIITLEFAQPFDPSQPLIAPGPRGVMIFDSDRSLSTGGLAMGAQIPTWGGDVDNAFEMLLDTDMNEATGVFWQDPQTPGGPGLGADYIMRVVSLDTGGAPVYAAVLEASNGFSSVHEAMVIAQPSAVAGQPGSFTVTISWELLGELGPRLRLFMTTGQRLGVGRLDTAPSAPMVLDVPINPGS